jgi:cytochrome c peroxidase
MKKKYILLSLAILILSVTFFQCKDDPDYIETNNFKATPFQLEIPHGFPTETYIPEDNPLTVEGIKLGRYLFYDGRLNGRTHPDSLHSCASCHLQEHAFDSPDKFPKGVTGVEMNTATLPLINLVWNPGVFRWNGSQPSLEDDALGVILSHAQFASSYEKVEETIQNIEMYPPLFEEAFGTDKVTVDVIVKSISQFVRTLVSDNAKIDRYLRGETNLTESERRGLILFTTEQGADCFHCHGAPGNPLFATFQFFNNAKDSVFNDPDDRYSVTGDPQDKGAYKAGTLRNIELTGPYMHDGRFATLEEVIDFYSEGLVWSPYADPLMHKLSPPYINGAKLNPVEKQDLLAFLKTLTDTTFITNPNFSDPFQK